MSLSLRFRGKTDNRQPDCSLTTLVKESPDAGVNVAQVSPEGEEEGTASPAVRNLLSSALELAPFVKGLLGDEVGVYVSDLERYVYCDHGKVRLSLKAGDVVKEGSITALALKTKRRSVGRVGKEVYGVPYIGVSFPLTEPGTGKVVGTLGMVMPIDQQEELVAMANKMEEQINNIAGATTNLSATAEELAATTENLNTAAQALKEEVQRTDNVVKLIRDIAEETHLLGLNAAIEAARVGDAGRGFAVVAGEIRKLSQSTQQSVKEVVQMLQEMQRSILDLAQSVEQVSAAAQQQAASVEEISASVDELNTLAGTLRKHSERLLQ